MKTLKYIIPVLLFAVIGFEACKKNPPKKDTTKCCQFEGVVTKHYNGCILTGNEPLAIRDNFENYFLVGEDKTGLFQGMKEGDSVCFNYELIGGCNFTNIPKQGIRYIPIACVKLTCIKKRSVKACGCSSPNDCGVIKPISYTQYTNKRYAPYAIMDGKIEGNKLTLKVAFSGCSDEDLELELAEGPTMGPTPTYMGILEYPKTTCEMLITKEVCYDISKYPSTSTFQIKDSKGVKSFQRK